MENLKASPLENLLAIAQASTQRVSNLEQELDGLYANLGRSQYLGDKNLVEEYTVGIENCILALHKAQENAKAKHDEAGLALWQEIENSFK